MKKLGHREVKVLHLESDRVGVQTQTVWLQSLFSYPRCYTAALCSVLGEENAMENSKAGLKESWSVGGVRF